jgi:hypothetical protein
MVPMSNSLVGEPCGNCYGQGQVPTDDGPVACPDCGGVGTLPGNGVMVEWRALEIERLHGVGNEQIAQDIRWLIFEVRRARSALTNLLALTEDLGDDPTTRQMRFIVNEALTLYRVTPAEKT